MIMGMLYILSMFFGSSVIKVFGSLCVWFHVDTDWNLCLCLFSWIWLHRWIWLEMGLSENRVPRNPMDYHQFPIKFICWVYTTFSDT